MAAKCASPAPPLGEKHIFENQTVKLGEDLPPKAKAYVDRLVELSGGKLGILSIGPARESTLRLAL